MTQAAFACAWALVSFGVTGFFLYVEARNHTIIAWQLCVIIAMLNLFAWPIGLYHTAAAWKE